MALQILTDHGIWMQRRPIQPVFLSEIPKGDFRNISNGGGRLQLLNLVQSVLSADTLLSREHSAPVNLTGTKGVRATERKPITAKAKHITTITKTYNMDTRREKP